MFIFHIRSRHLMSYIKGTGNKELESKFTKHISKQN